MAYTLSRAERRPLRIRCSMLLPWADMPSRGRGEMATTQESTPLIICDNSQRNSGLSKRRRTDSAADLRATRLRRMCKADSGIR